MGAHLDTAGRFPYIPRPMGTSEWSAGAQNVLRRADGAVGVVVAIGPAVVGLVLFASMKSVATRWSPSAATALWGLLLLGSFVGWGAGVNAVCVPARRFDLGMRATLGAATYIAVGGVLALLALVSKVTIAALIAVGLLVYAVVEYRDRRGVVAGWRRAGLLAWQAPLYALAIVALLAAGIIQYLDAATPNSSDFNDCDDFIAYFEFARQLIGSGTLIEPYSLRRIGSLGGQTLLQASILPYGSVWQLHFIDRGLFFILPVLLIVGVLRWRPSSGRLGVLLALASLVALPNTRINTSSQMTGAALLLGLYRLISGGYLPRANAIGVKEHVRRAIPLALVAAAVCTLRQNYMLPVGLLFIFVYGGALVTRLPSPLRALPAKDAWPLLREVATVALVTVALLVPWMALSYLSDRTFLFPMMKGNFRPDFGMLESGMSAIGRSQFLVKNALYDLPVKSFGLFVFAAIVAVDRRRGRPLHAFVAAVILGAIALVRAFELADPPNLGRYYYALEVALVVAITLDVVGRPPPRGPRGLLAMPATLAMAAASLYLMDVKGSVASAYDRWLGALTAFGAPPGIVDDGNDATFKAMQATVPPKAPLVVMVDAPFRFDFARNPVMNFDIPGAVSPGASVPVLDGPEPLAGYFLEHGVRYVAFVPDTSDVHLYSRKVWEENSRPSAALIWRLQSKFYLAAFRDFTELTRTRKHLYDQHGYIVLDLATASSSPG